MTFIFKFSRHSCEGTIGCKPAPRPREGLEHATKVIERHDRPWYDPRTHEAVPMEGLNRMAIEKAGTGGMTPEGIVEWFNACEEAGQHERAIALVGRFDRAVARAEPLGLSVLRNCNTVESATKRRGLDGIPSAARRRIRIGCGILQAENHRQCLTLCTVTEPSLAPEQHEIYASQFSNISRQFVAEVRRQLKRCGMSEDLLYVKEIQEKRFSRYQQVSLHLHLVWVGKKNRFDSEWAVSKEWVRDVWANILKRFLKTDIETGSATRVECPRGSLRGELGKYLTKGCSVAKQAQNAGFSHHLPGQWWGSSRSLKAKIDASIERADPVISGYVFRHLTELKDMGLLSYWAIAEQGIDEATGKTWVRPPGASISFKSEAAIAEVLQIAHEATYGRAERERQAYRVEIYIEMITTAAKLGMPGISKSVLSKLNQKYRELQDLFTCNSAQDGLSCA